MYETEEIHDEILDTTSQISRFIHVTLSPKKSATQPPSPTHQESPQMVYNETPLVPGGVQKFSYLKAQLTGDASRAIAGFPLSNVNYEQAIKLLKERFGQPSKITSAHMQALLDIASPINQLTSLQLFYDTMENHVRGLESLGRSHKSYGISSFQLSWANYPMS